ncbi:hypothetical protein SLEP1_g45816 [Rubroshorea leprosula]|uniref:Uncharacterized protein n=1 Tax=Rubroshorea leprosula TaxID=152421 RepID=A0AAV5LM15_9ROSI|nr:hypothetical protein SLEP1_g45816 [Rubroshorea leprosula]
MQTFLPLFMHMKIKNKMKGEQERGSTRSTDSFLISSRLMALSLAMVEAQLEETVTEGG